MKQRFSSFDVKVIAHELSHKLCTLRLANVYDLSSRIFLFKFARSDRREQLVVESGFRCHLTSFSRTTAAAPSAFVARLRKFLRSRRVTAVTQIGTDRIIQFQFSDGAYNLFLEFFAGGNIVLTDRDLNILALLRIVSEGVEHEEVRTGLNYALSNRQNYAGVPPLTRQRILDGVQKVIENEKENTFSSGSKAKRKSGDALRRALTTTITEYPPALISDALYLAKVDTSVPLSQVLLDEDLIAKLMDAMEKAKKIVQLVTSSEVVRGYIIAKPRAGGTGLEPSEVPVEQSGTSSRTMLYEDFHPFAPQKMAEDPNVSILPFEGFNKTVDEYFSSIEGQKLETRLQDREDHAKKKLESARKDHENRLSGLEIMQQLSVRKAQAIEANIQKVEEAIVTINGLVGQGMDWMEIARLIELEQERHNPLAEIIKLPLKLHENTITLLLGELTNEEDDEIDDETDSEVSDDDADSLEPAKNGDSISRLSIDLDLSLSPWGNARQYYDQKRVAAEKEQKTLQQSSKALKNTERKINADLAKGLKQEKEPLRPVRKQIWFEKFIYFISSDGYLVVGGRDRQQDETLYRRYFNTSDVYVSADLDGAASLFIKNHLHTPEAPIPPSTLSQAGIMAVATSSAWDSKAVMSPWWVNSNQVARSVSVEGFLVHGDKNFLPPAQLILGFGVLFQISDESKTTHMKHRWQDEEVRVSSRDINPGEGTECEKDNSDNSDNQGEKYPESDEDEDEGFPDAKLEHLSDDNENEAIDPGAPLPAPVASVDPETPKPLTLHEAVGEQSESESLGTVDELGAQDDDEQFHQVRGSVELTPMARDQAVSAASDNVPPLASSTEPKHGNSAGGEEEKLKGSQAESETVAKRERTSAAPSSEVGRHVRGKRGKQKKLASKYRDQDEEDRQIAMKLLGSAAAQAKAEEGAKARQSRKETMELQKKRRREQHSRAAREILKHEEARQRQNERGPGAPDEEEDQGEQQQALAVLGNFVGTPLPGDDILAAIPVCAPWSAMVKCKYRAKLQPGSQKKGKAVKDILSRWLHHDSSSVSNSKKRSVMVDEKSEDVEKMWPKELELIKSWRETEIFNVVPVGKVKVVMSSSGIGGRGQSVSRNHAGKKKGGGGDGGGGNATKLKARGGKGSKKQ